MAVSDGRGRAEPLLQRVRGRHAPAVLPVGGPGHVPVRPDQQAGQLRAVRATGGQDGHPVAVAVGVGPQPGVVGGVQQQSAAGVQVVGEPAAVVEGESPLDALRRLGLGLLDSRHPLSGVDDDFPPFWRVVLDSPALRARAREGVEELEAALARAFAETAPEYADPRLAAALTVAAYRAVYVGSAGRLLAGDGADEVAADHRGRLVAAFDALGRALGAP